MRTPISYVQFVFEGLLKGRNYLPYIISAVIFEPIFRRTKKSWKLLLASRQFLVKTNDDEICE